MYIGLCLAVAIIGFIIFSLSKNEKVVELGKAMMWTGLLSFLISAPSFLTVLGGKLR